MTALMLSSEMFGFVLLIFAHFQYVLIDIWISKSFEAGCQPPPHFFLVPSEHEFIN